MTAEPWDGGGADPAVVQLTSMVIYSMECICAPIPRGAPLHTVCETSHGRSLPGPSGIMIYGQVSLNRKQ